MLFSCSWHANDIISSTQKELLQPVCIRLGDGVSSVFHALKAADIKTYIQLEYWTDTISMKEGDFESLDSEDMIVNEVMSFADESQETEPRIDEVFLVSELDEETCTDAKRDFDEFKPVAVEERIDEPFLVSKTGHVTGSNSSELKEEHSIEEKANLPVEVGSILIDKEDEVEAMLIEEERLHLDTEKRLKEIDWVRSGEEIRLDVVVERGRLEEEKKFVEAESLGLDEDKRMGERRRKTIDEDMHPEGEVLRTKKNLQVGSIDKTNRAGEKMTALKYSSIADDTSHARPFRRSQFCELYDELVLL
jgi:hypothetical protein